VGGGVLGQAVSTAAANGIPVHITGTTSNPVIQADLSKLLQKNAGNISQAAISGQWQQQAQSRSRAQQALPSH
jgi:3-hydroxyacyl-CoA dehydrogenase